MTIFTKVPNIYRSGWIFSLAPVVKPDFDYACTQLVKFGEFFKYPGVLGLFVQGLKELIRHEKYLIYQILIILKAVIIYSNVVIVKLFRYHYEINETYNQKWNVFVESTALFAYV